MEVPDVGSVPTIPDPSPWIPPLQQAQRADPSTSLFDVNSSLASLELAAFLDGLDRVELKASDGFTPAMLMQQQQQLQQQQQQQRHQFPVASGSNDASISGVAHSDIPASIQSQMLPPSSTAPSSEWSRPMMLDEGVSYAVPSDFSWWNFGIEAGAPSTSALQPPPLAQRSGFTGLGADIPAMDPALFGHANAFQDEQGMWPRGSEDGMGSGELRTKEGEVLTGGPWPGAPASADSTAAQNTGTLSNCCTKRGEETKIREQGLPTPSAHTQDRSTVSSRSHGQVKSPACCSSKAQTPDQSSARAPRKGPCPRTGAASCCCNSTDVDSATTATNLSHPQRRAEGSPPRIFCVPAPSGDGCTCLCESEVCLLRVRRQLDSPSVKHDKALNEEGRIDTGSDTGSGITDESHLLLTLTASKAVSASCACSANCPTCSRGTENPLKRNAFNASLLISLSLQIYARAVRILRDGFGSGTSSMGSAGGCNDDIGDGNAQGLGGLIDACDLEVTIGNGRHRHRPRKENARKIALLMMRLELVDLEAGMARVVRAAAGGDGVSTDKNRAPTKHPLGPPALALAPVDQLVIRKLRQQLKEMIARVEMLERA
ncbi:unnamed protein product [Jaminaea pallidilutea]